MEISISKKIKGFNYYVSDQGVVTNAKGQVIKPEDNGKGYLYVNLCKDGKVTHIAVHKLVAMTFLVNDNPEENEVMHKDGNRQRNCFWNLQWGTHKENMNDELTRQKLSEANIGRQHSEETKKKMSESRKGKGAKKVYCIELDKVFDSISQAEQELEIGRGNITKVCKGKRKTAGGFHWKYAE